MGPSLWSFRDAISLPSPHRCFEISPEFSHVKRCRGRKNVFTSNIRNSHCSCELHLGGCQKSDKLSQLLQIHFLLKHGGECTVKLQCGTKFCFRKITISLKLYWLRGMETYDPILQFFFPTHVRHLLHLIGTEHGLEAWSFPGVIWCWRWALSSSLFHTGHLGPLSTS